MQKSLFILVTLLSFSAIADGTKKPGVLEMIVPQIVKQIQSPVLEPTSLTYIDLPGDDTPALFDLQFSLQSKILNDSIQIELDTKETADSTGISKFIRVGSKGQLLSVNASTDPQTQWTNANIEFKAPAGQPIAACTGGDNCLPITFGVNRTDTGQEVTKTNLRITKLDIKFDLSGQADKGSPTDEVACGYKRVYIPDSRISLRVDCEAEKKDIKGVWKTSTACQYVYLVPKKDDPSLSDAEKAKLSGVISCLKFN